MFIAHIGLGKTGTTSLQNFVFSRLVDMGIVSTYGRLKTDEFGKVNNLDEIKRYKLDNEHHLISDESLIGWNPRRAEYNRDLNTLFGDSATILITIKSQNSYMRSLYLQQLQIGNVVSPYNFMLDSDTYNKVEKKIFDKNTTMFFDVDAFDLEYMIRLYTDYFKKVVVVPISSIDNLDFLQELFPIRKDQILTLKNDMNKVRRLNSSYSKIAVKLTLYRENIANIFGLTTRSSSCLSWSVSRYLNTSLKSKMTEEQIRREVMDNSWLKKTERRIKGLTQWRWVMRDIISRLFTRPYTLPENINKGKFFLKNEEFYQKVENNKKGYLVYEKYD